MTSVEDHATRLPQGEGESHEAPSPASSTDGARALGAPSTPPRPAAGSPTDCAHCKGNHRAAHTCGKRRARPAPITTVEQSSRQDYPYYVSSLCAVLRALAQSSAEPRALAPAATALVRRLPPRHSPRAIAPPAVPPRSVPLHRSRPARGSTAASSMLSRRRPSLTPPPTTRCPSAAAYEPASGCQKVSCRRQYLRGAEITHMRSGEREQNSPRQKTRTRQAGARSRPIALGVEVTA
jgi:hypothetical protein